MATLITRFANVYSSDSAYTASLLLALGLFGSTASMWIRLAA